MMVRIVGQTARAGGTDRVPMLSGHCLASAARLGFAFDREAPRGARRACAFSGTVKQCMANFARDRRRLPKDGG
ncbi:hypothetical protein PPH41_07055, partial [Burkholderia gladioli]|nr:hypothetical protein [Burkholderia gladioli]